MNRSNLYFFLCNLLFLLVTRIGNVEGIVGGTKADQNRHKFIVSVHVENSYVCGGVIIGEYHVLTAAHCVIEKSGKYVNKQISVMAGMIDLNVKNHKGIKQVVEDIFVPKIYRGIIIDTFSEIGDIAVLKVKQGFDLSPNSIVQKVHLPLKNNKVTTTSYRDYGNEMATVFGFGEDYQLNYASAVVLKAKECSRMSSFPATEKHICAQINQQDSKPKGTCLKDGGGPLVIYENENSSNSPMKAVVIGVLVQSRDDCNEKFGPALYTRVTSFIDFIDAAVANIKDRNIVRFFSYTPGTSKAAASTKQ